MATTINAVLRKKAKKDGTYPIALRVTKDKKSSYFYLGHSIDEKDWDSKQGIVKKSHPNSKWLNNLISSKLVKADATRIEMNMNETDTSSRVIIKRIKPQKGVSFFDQSKIFMDNLRKHGKYNRVNSEEPRINRLREYLQGQDIAFHEITVSLLEGFKAYLKSTRKILGKPISERTIINHLIVIRTIYNQAIKEGIVDLKHYPFGKDKIKIKLPESVKIGLLPEEVQKIEALDLSDRPNLHHARNIWLFSFYFAGMRISDVLRLTWSEIQNDRLYYSMGKNLKAGSLKIPQKALFILDQYRNHEKKNDLVFPELKTFDKLDNIYEIQRKIALAVSVLNTALGKISKELGIDTKVTTHIARHTFGNISGDKIPIQMLQKLYRHSAITTTIGYQANFIFKDADDALDSVIEF